MRLDSFFQIQYKDRRATYASCMNPTVDLDDIYLSVHASPVLLGVAESFLLAAGWLALGAGQ